MLSVPACDQYLVSGPEGVTNSQLSESSTWCAVIGSHLPVCQPASMRYESAWYARLGSQGDTSGCWSAAYEDAAQFVQVEYCMQLGFSRRHDWLFDRSL